MDGAINSLYSRQNRALNIEMPQASSNEPMCCFCIPMRLAMWLMGLLLLSDVAKLLAFTMSMKELSQVVFVVSAVASGLAGLSVILFLRYICGRFGSRPASDSAGKKSMVIAMALMIFVNII